MRFMKSSFIVLTVLLCVFNLGNVNAQSPCDFSFSISTQASTTPTSCNGVHTVTVTGNTGPFTYVWLNSNSDTVSTTNVAGNLCPGAYTLIVCDTVCCASVVADIGVNNLPGVITLVLKNDTVDCSGDTNGILKVDAFGGVPPYTYTWSNGGGTQTIAGLLPDNYDVTVQDFQGRQSQAFTYVYDRPKLLTSFVTTDVTCHDKCNGFFTITASGSNGGYWLDYNGFMKNFPGGVFAGSGLCPDTYVLTIGDKLGCSEVVSSTVDAPLPVTATFDVNHASNCSTCDASLTMTISGGVGGYLFMYDNVIYNYNAPVSAGGLCANYYPILLADDNYCIGTATAFVDCFGPKTGLDNQELEASISPNPATDIVKVAADLVNIFDISGKLVQTHEQVEIIDVIDIPNGVYIVEIVDGDLIKTEKLIIQH